ncbi:hypothetical protein KV557_24810 [Kitasatospora aureofaciens]|uniref:M14 family zinc carboxypeptidase n=1 Tax=Kitasatospora aureofaciens TaxID=1894 RepID=UPI001C47C492|nr:M14 family zinc carboxypeptidase [Kitasatospora aureofaciens]MBV6700287.1 hypothetical protein [Kitasatospora aureofaciens]
MDERLAGYARLVPAGELVPSVGNLVRRLRALADREPGLCRMRQIGTSRQGRALHVLSVGMGRRAALVVGGPHPNEPVGYATVSFLANLVAARPELRRDVAWHFLPCVDPDGAAMNSGWTSVPLDLHRQHRYFYRPALAEQAEWTFPIPFGDGVHSFGLPENAALAALVDELEPIAAISLHNADFGAAFHIVSHEVPGLAAQLGAVAARHGLAGGAAPSDVAGWPVLGPGVYAMPPVDEVVIRDHEADAPAHGAHLVHYASRYSTLTVLPEVPRWHTGAAFDDAPADALGALADALGAEATEIRQLMAEAGDLDDASGRAAADTLAVADTVTRSWQHQAAAGGIVAGAELAEAHYTRVQLSLRSAGLALRAAADTSQADPGARARLDRALSERTRRAERELRMMPVPLNRLVAVQACTALAACALAR